MKNTQNSNNYNNENYEKKSKGKKRKKMKSRVKITLQLITIIVLSTVTAGIFYFYFNYGSTILKLQSDAKEKVYASDLNTFRASQTSTVYDTNGKVISSIRSIKDVYYLEYEEIPKVFVDAMVVSEDRKYLQHGGVDYIANVRAAIALIKNKGRKTQGASTITQQLARTIFLSYDKTYERKIAEIYIAEAMEKKYSKTQIMEFYLNNIYFANGRYGIQAASKAYFGKNVKDLSISQAAFLCAIPNNPNLYNPITNYENTIKRRDRIIRQLYDEGKITLSDYDNAREETIKLLEQKTEKNNYVDTYVTYSVVRSLMTQRGFQFRNEFEDEEDKKAYQTSYEEMYTSCQKNMYTAGYQIYTSIDMKKQELLQKSVDNALKKFKDVGKDKIYELQGAAVCIDNKTGKVVAIVGGRSQDLGGYTLNRGYQSYRQPGSSIKPLVVYTPAFEKGYTPVTSVVDKPFKDGPKNSGGKYNGKMKLQRAVELSKNTVAWKVFEDITPKVGLEYLHKMNFSRIVDSDYNLASSLGGLTYGVSPVEMASAYAALENDGYYRMPTCVIKILDADGNEIVNNKPKTKQIYMENASKTMTEVLTGVIKNGTGRGLGLKNTVSAGKTGTTNDKKDGWFCGYTPYYTTTVWVGYDMPKSMPDLTGGTYPGTIWHNFMNQIHNSSMKDTFEFYDWRSKIKKKVIKDTEEVTPTEAIIDPEEGDITEEIDNGEVIPEEDDNSDTIEEEPIDNSDPEEFEDPDTANQGNEGDTDTNEPTTDDPINSDNSNDNGNTNNGVPSNTVPTGKEANTGLN